MKKQTYFLFLLAVLYSMGQLAFAQNMASNYGDGNGHNESWMYFEQTAFNNPAQNAVEVNLWLRDLGDTDVRLQRFRYDLTFLKVMQLGIQSNVYSEDKDGADKYHHSSYTSLKYTVADRSISPVSVAIGIKKRLYWNSKNKDFETGKDTDDNNDKRNKLTLFAALTGETEVAELDVMGNIYLDNQSVTLGTKVGFIPEIKILLDSIHYIYKNAVVSNDLAFGIQFLNPAGATATVAYQKERKQTMLGIGFSW